MAATADPRAKPPAGPATHHLEPWARQQQPPRAHRVRVAARPAVEEEEESRTVGASADLDRRSSFQSQRRGATDGEVEGGVEELRAKLMGHLRHAADSLRAPQASPPLPPPPPKPASPRPEREPSPVPTPPGQHQQDQEQQADVSDKPWKLRERTRRRPAALTSWPAAPSPPSSKSRRRRKRAPFSVSLALEEIEEDIYALTGGRPRRRPRKRPRAVQRQLDSLLPGNWLTEITADDYKVPEPEE